MFFSGVRPLGGPGCDGGAGPGCPRRGAIHLVLTPGRPQQRDYGGPQRAPGFNPALDFHFALRPAFACSVVSGWLVRANKC